VAMVVVLVPKSPAGAYVRPKTLHELAGLGVTSIAILRDASLDGLVLEGWAFDPRDAMRAARAVVGARPDARVLQPLAHMAVAPAAASAADRKE
jgi:hypothetical protein